MVRVMPGHTPNAPPPTVRGNLVSDVSRPRSRGIPDPDNGGARWQLTRLDTSVRYEPARRSESSCGWFVVAAVAAVAVFNTQDVDLDWIVGESTLPLWVVIAVLALAGAVIGYVARRRRD